MKKTLFLGTFNAENFWKDKSYAKLPEMTDNSSSRIISAMDELLFPLCKKNDVLLTRYSMNPVFKNYLNDIGFSFSNNIHNIEDLVSLSNNSKDICMFELLKHINKNSYFTNLINKIDTCSPYAVLPQLDNTVKKFNWNYHYPSIEIIKKVNSKEYSNELNKRITNKKYGIIIKSISDLELAFETLYNPRGFLLKDLYGVSGKGNFLIYSPSIFKRILKHIRKQEDKGLKIHFLAEPYFKRECDFSCQIKIDKSFNIIFLSIQKINNNAFSFLGSYSADNNFINYLEKKGYFKIMRQVAEELCKDGYFGDLCIDSMILKNGEIIPIVEINARKSMGLINQYIDQFLYNFSTKGYFVFFNVSFKERINFSQILQKIDEKGILFNKKRSYGILPLSCNTLFANQMNDNSEVKETSIKGRFYFSSVADTQEKRQELVIKVIAVLKSLNFNVYYNQ